MQMRNEGRAAGRVRKHPARALAAPAFAAAFGSVGCGDATDAGPSAGDVSQVEQAIRDGLESQVEDVVVLEVWDGSNWKPACTGTALRNDVVLTAQHCLGIVANWPFSLDPWLHPIPARGTLSEPEFFDLRVATWDRSQIVQPSNVVRLRELNYMPAYQASNGLWAALAQDAKDFKSDAALLFFDGDNLLTLSGDDVNHKRDISIKKSSDMDGELHLCVGFGANAGGAGSTTGAGTQRWGWIQVFQPPLHEGGPGYVQYWPNYTSPNGTIQMNGDSGGSCFEYDGYWFNVASVNSYTPASDECPDCTSTHYPTETVGAEVFLIEARNWLDLWENRDSWFFDSEPQNKQIVTPTVWGGTPEWTVTGGQLRENSNAYGNYRNGLYEGPMYIRDGIYANPEVEVSVTSSDNDAAGLVLRYQEDENYTHYYRASFDEQRGYLRIIKRSMDETTILAEQAIDVDHSNPHRLVFRAYEHRLQAVLTGSDVDVTLTAEDTGPNALRNGRVGIYEWALADARFDDFRSGPSGPF